MEYCIINIQFAEIKFKTSVSSWNLHDWTVVW